jgi:hypothetical protein
MSVRFVNFVLFLYLGTNRYKGGKFQNTINVITTSGNIGNTQMGDNNSYKGKRTVIRLRRKAHDGQKYGLITNFLQGTSIDM